MSLTVLQPALKSYTMRPLNPALDTSIVNVLLCYRNCLNGEIVIKKMLISNSSIDVKICEIVET